MTKTKLLPILIGFSLLAFQAAKAGSDFGFIGGVSLNFDKAPPANNVFSVNSGVVVGGFYKYSWKFFYLRPELLFAIKGNPGVDTLKTQVLGEPVSYTRGALPNGGYKLYHVDAPLLAGLQFGGFFVQAGPVLSINTKAEQTYGEAAYVGSTFDEKKIDLGLMGGIGYKIGIGSKFGIPIELNYGQSLTPIYTITNVSHQVLNGYNQYLNLTIGFQF